MHMPRHWTAARTLEVVATNNAGAGLHSPPPAARRGSALSGLNAKMKRRSLSTGSLEQLVGDLAAEVAQLVEHAE